MLNTPIKEQLQSFKDEFDPLILSVNQRIASGENKRVKVKQIKASNSTDPDSSDSAPNSDCPDSDSVKKKTSTPDANTWSFAYPKKDETINNPFFEQLPKATLNQVLRLVNKHCNFIKEFTHVKSRYSKTPIDESAVFACIAANATNYGIYQMATISDINYNKLSAISQHYLRLETLNNANNCLNKRYCCIANF